MFSTLTHRGAAATLDALRLGARDYVTKPANVGSVNHSIEAIRSELIPKIKALCGEQERPLKLAALTHKTLHRTAMPRPAVIWPIEVVAIATSTGGPNALAEVLPQMPPDLRVAILVVQHMPPAFTRFLAERLNNECRMPVAEASDNLPLRAGKILIAPGDYHMAVEQRGLQTQIRTLRTPPENSCRPAADVLFRSVAQVYGSRALGVVMTGMGQDGLRGAQEMHKQGAAILAQDEATSVVWGMPGFVAQAGLAAKVVPLPEIAAEIVRRVRESHRFGRPAESGVHVHHAG
jgi:two-component system chemotaxis response regulator CheB